MTISDFINCHSNNHIRIFRYISGTEEQQYISYANENNMDTESLLFIDNDGIFVKIYDSMMENESIHFDIMIHEISWYYDTEESDYPVYEIMLK